MSKLRENLRSLMERAGHTPYDIQQKTGIPPSTTYRFLEGNHGDPRSSTVKKWAMLYNVSESQLRGDLPIDGLESPPEQLALKDLLPIDEYNLVKRVKSLDEKARVILFNLAEALAEPQAEYRCNANPAERRREDIVPNSQLRFGEPHHRPPPAQRHIKTRNDRYINGKASRSA